MKVKKKPMLFAIDGAHVNAVAQGTQEKSGKTRWKRPLRWKLAALRSVENNPDREVFTKVFDVVRGSRRDEHQVAGLEVATLTVVYQDAAAADDDVDLVLCMRSLSVRRCRERKFYVQGAAP
jgi:hypothetical protein